MLFNSYVFTLAFLPLVLLGWWIVFRHVAMRLMFLTLASYLFYGWWDFRFVGLLAISTVVDFAAGHGIFRSKSSGKRAWLAISLATNLGLLAFGILRDFLQAGPVSA